MASFVHQTSRSLLFIVAFLLIIGCCSSEDDYWPHKPPESSDESPPTSSKAGTNESGMKKKPILLYVLIGVIAFVVVLLVIIVILVALLCQRRRRRRARDSIYAESESGATSNSLESVVPLRTKPKGAGVPTKAKGYGMPTKTTGAGATMPKDSRWVPSEFRSNMPMPKEKLETFWPAASRAKGVSSANATVGQTMAKGIGTNVHPAFTRDEPKTKGAAPTAKASAGRTKVASDSNVYVW
ncbi:hypothetical protein GPALN_010889 [Globodera pallida]|uniref:Transmembrane protein n=1 Tax=Globodera pallida TaxID=36090 RepID=A0A183BUC9_GLOPA|nr:hypothetical protein GPALN_010889 [Globodera pallida]